MAVSHLFSLRMQAHVVEDLLPADVGKHIEDVHLLEARAGSLQTHRTNPFFPMADLLSVLQSLHLHI